MSLRRGGREQRKSELRREVARRLGSISRQERAESGRLAIERLKAMVEFSRALSLMLYSSTDDEIDTSALIDESLASGKRVYLPLCERDRNAMCAVRIADREADTVPGRFGIREPRPGLESASPERLDFVLVPGRAFDRGCNRLGRGRGFYDRFLAATARGGGRTVAVALDLQLFDEIPTETHDIPIDAVVTESQIIRRGSGVGRGAAFGER